MIVVVPGGGITGVQDPFVCVLPGYGFSGSMKVPNESGVVDYFGVGRVIVCAEINA